MIIFLGFNESCFYFRLLPKSEMRTRGNRLPDAKLHFKIRYSRKEPINVGPFSSKRSKVEHKLDSVSKILRPAKCNISKTAQKNQKKGGRTRLELIPAFKLSDFPPEPSHKEKIENLSEEEIENCFSSSNDSVEVNTRYFKLP